MPFKSKAQRRKFAALLVQGDITPETFEEWNRSTGSKKLPERVRPKKTQAARKKQVVRKKRTTRKVAARKKKRPARKGRV